MIDGTHIKDLDAQQLRQMVRTMIADAAGKDGPVAFKQALINKLTHNMAVLKQLKVAAQSDANRLKESNGCRIGALRGDH